ncbi:MAG: HAD family hydrolase, partial [Gammaproteobacteria bacterium]
PPRDAVHGAIQTLHTAGIRVVMITGDRPDTATAIATQLELSDRDAIRGETVVAMSPEELAEAVASTEVFARVDPESKLRIIEALQAAGE